MNWNPFKKKRDESDPVVDFTLSDLKPGYVVDYDLKTWKVTAQNYYDYDGDRVDEWELTCADDVVYLEREEDDGLCWTLSRKVPISRLDGDPQSHVVEHEDPPEEVTCNGVTYFAESSDAGEFYKDGADPPRELIVWEYLDDSERKTLSIEQWGEDDYEASIGEIVEEYQFSDILPIE